MNFVWIWLQWNLSTHSWLKCSDLLFRCLPPLLSVSPESITWSGHWTSAFELSWVLFPLWLWPSPSCISWPEFSVIMSFSISKSKKANWKFHSNFPSVFLSFVIHFFTYYYYSCQRRRSKLDSEYWLRIICVSHNWEMIVTRFVSLQVGKCFPFV